jgi:hypothetical protein
METEGARAGRAIAGDDMVDAEVDQAKIWVPRLWSSVALLTIVGILASFVAFVSTGGSLVVLVLLFTCTAAGWVATQQARTSSWVELDRLAHRPTWVAATADPHAPGHEGPLTVIRAWTRGQVPVLVAFDLRVFVAIELRPLTGRVTRRVITKDDTVDFEVSHPPSLVLLEERTSAWRIAIVPQPETRWHLRWFGWMSIDAARAEASKTASALSQAGWPTTLTESRAGIVPVNW